MTNQCCFIQALLQQFVVDIYIKLETYRPDNCNKWKNEIRTEKLWVIDSLSIGKTNGNRVGWKIILSPSFIGGPRDIRHR